MDDDDVYSDSNFSDEFPDNNYLTEIYRRLTSEALTMNDDSDNSSEDLSYLVYDADEDEDFDTDFQDYDDFDVEDDDLEVGDSLDAEDEMSGEEDDDLSQASTLLNEGQEQPSQSGTDTEIEPEREVEVEEEIVQTQKKIKLDEPEEVPVENIANESLDEDQKCPICLETWSNAGEHRLCSLRCGHLFGLKCITQWFNVAQNATARKCPECNAKASRKDIRILYAKGLKCIDTIEIEKLKEQLKEVSTKKEIAEKELHNYRTKEVFYKQEISFLKQKVSELQKLSERKDFCPQSENILLRKNKVFDICKKNSCRVMAYNPWNKILVISSGNAINRIFVDTLSVSLNCGIHNGSIRDLAFQKHHPNILLSVSFDKKVSLTDIRSNILTHSYQEVSNLWSCCWSSHSTQTFFVGGARGDVTEYDIRYLQSGVSKKENTEDRSPVVSLASVSTSSPALRAGGYLACQLNSCSAYGYKEGNYVGNRIELEGPFTSLRHMETKKLRMVMRRDQVLKLCLNHAVTSALEITSKDNKTWMWSATDYSEGEIEYMQFACRFKTPEVADEFKQAVDDACESMGSETTTKHSVSTTAPAKGNKRIIKRFVVGRRDCVRDQSNTRRKSCSAEASVTRQLLFLQVQT